MNLTSLMVGAAATGRLDAVTALVECGANVNIHQDGYTAIYWAIMGGHHQIVEYLCLNGAVSSWGPTGFYGENVLEAAALWGSARMMDVLADSVIPRVECSAAVMESCLLQYRQSVCGKRCTEEEFAAFQRLIQKKAILTDGERVWKPIRLQEEALVEDMENMDENGHGETEDENEIFEDAAEEHFPVDESITPLPGEFS